ncbi:MAG: hypothetical protein PHQ61_03730 [Candidatus Omnitrophica bacterium]|nr:hypothetical protein [Candidatus Omnitrophota bacterium]
MIKRLLLSVFFVTLSFVGGVASIAGVIDRMSGDYIPVPRMIAPVTSEVNISGEREVSFKWDAHAGRNDPGRFYIFRLYSGKQATEDALMVKEELASEAGISISSERFVPGQFYTWSVQQGYTGKGKSDKGYQTFQVIKE